MKYIGVILVGIIIISIGCKDDDVNISPIEQFVIDTNIIDDWIVENNIQDTLVEAISKIRYTLKEEGTGINPRAFVQDTIVVDYTGRILLTGEVFDSGESSEINLDTTIKGWQIMLPEIKEGGEFTIYLPSLFAYGTEGRGNIPPNAVLVFDIKLLRVGG